MKVKVFIKDGKKYIQVGDEIIPVVGTLTNKTRPEDFKRFAKIADLLRKANKSGKA